MPVQTTYATTHGAAFEGQKVDLQLYNTTSKAVETALGIPFGRAVVRGTLDNQCLLPTSTGQLFLGITQMTSAGIEDADGVHQYEYLREANIFDFGKIYVYTEQSVVPGNAVYFRHTADTAPLNVVGRFRKDASGGDADLITGAAWETTTAAGSFGIVNLNNPGVGVLLAPDSSETVTATTSVSALTTSITYVDTTLGAMALSLADGTEGQIKKILMTVDGGDCIITPANLAKGATLRLTDVFNSYTLQFSGASWKVIAHEGKATVTITASGAVPLDADIVLLNSTSGAQANTLADGYIGQELEMRMIVATNNAVLTPTNLEVGATLRNTEVGSSYSLVFTGTNWKVSAREGKAIVTITAATTAVMPLDVDIFIFDTTVGASTGAIAAGYAGQVVEMKMLTDGGDQVITPATFADGTTITFDNTDSATIFSDGTNWLSSGTPTATIA